MKIYVGEYHIKDYRDVIKAVEHYTGLRYENEIRAWLSSATLRMWAAGYDIEKSKDIDKYAKALSDLSAKPVTRANLEIAIRYAREETKSLGIPDFFRALVSVDKRAKSSCAEELIAGISFAICRMAPAGEKLPDAAAIVLDEITTNLANYCTKTLTPLEHVTDTIENYGNDVAKRISEVYRSVINLNPGSIGDPEIGSVFDANAMNISGSSTPSTSQGEATDSGDNTVSVTVEQGTLGVSVQRQDEAKEMTEEEKKAELDSVLAELDSLVGLATVKEDVRSLMNFIRICQLRTERGMNVPTVSYHLVFTGNPGTGKTTVARMVAKLYYLMGLLSQGQLVETDRSGLVAGYVGQTAIKTQKVIQEAMGGVLFIDEAYALANDSQDSYGKEAIETILKAMEDHRDELVVIVAGYDNLMHKFIDSNPGLRSRFNKYFNFPDYDGEDLYKILERFCEKNGYALDEEAIPQIKEYLDDIFENREEHFGNARTVRNLFENAINNQANRLSSPEKSANQECTGDVDAPASSQDLARSSNNMPKYDLAKLSDEELSKLTAEDFDLPPKSDFDIKPDSNMSTSEIDEVAMPENQDGASNVPIRFGRSGTKGWL